MSASIRIKIIGGTDIKTAYYDCDAISRRLGGVAVETNFNGVEMFYNHQTLERWVEYYHHRLCGVSTKGESDGC